MLCHWPFDRLHIHNDLFITCCPAWHTGEVSIPVGEYKSPWQIWTHPTLRKFRDLMNAGDRSACGKCMMLKSGVVQPDGETIEVMTRGPKVIVLANAKACNLHCWSCRPGIISKVPQAEQTKRIMNEVVDYFLPELEWLSLEQSGEIFASPMHVELLQRLRPTENLSIELFTNGLPLPANWHRIAHLEPNIKRLLISVDAATEETYEKTRLGGKWKDLLKTMAFARDFRERRATEYLQFNFVVTSANFREIPAFVDLCEAHSADKAMFTPFVKMPHMNDELFDAMNVMAKSHSAHEEFLAVMKDPRITKPCCDVSCLSY